MYACWGLQFVTENEYSKLRNGVVAGFGAVVIV